MKGTPNTLLFCKNYNIIFYYVKLNLSFVNERETYFLFSYFSDSRKILISFYIGYPVSHHYIQIQLCNPVLLIFFVVAVSIFIIGYWNVPFMQNDNFNVVKRLCFGFFGYRKNIHFFIIYPGSYFYFPCRVYNFVIVTYVVLITFLYVIPVMFQQKILFFRIRAFFVFCPVDYSFLFPGFRINLFRIYLNRTVNFLKVISIMIALRTAFYLDRCIIAKILACNLNQNLFRKCCIKNQNLYRKNFINKFLNFFNELFRDAMFCYFNRMFLANRLHNRLSLASVIRFFSLFTRCVANLGNLALPLPLLLHNDNYAYITDQYLYRCIKKYKENRLGCVYLSTLRYMKLVLTKIMPNTYDLSISYNYEIFSIHTVKLHYTVILHYNMRLLCFIFMHCTLVVAFIITTSIIPPISRQCFPKCLEIFQMLLCNFSCRKPKKRDIKNLMTLLFCGSEFWELFLKTHVFFYYFARVIIFYLRTGWGVFHLGKKVYNFSKIMFKLKLDLIRFFHTLYGSNCTNSFKFYTTHLNFYCDATMYPSDTLRILNNFAIFSEKFYQQYYFKLLCIAFLDFYFHRYKVYFFRYKIVLVRGSELLNIFCCFLGFSGQFALFIISKIKKSRLMQPLYFYKIL